MSAASIPSPGRAAAWKLSPPPSAHPAESAILPDDGRRRDEESIIGEDQRVLVDFSDLQEGGKYRSIVKIQARFENKATGKSVWMMGTGWLIRPDLLVTAGHVVYDWGHRFGAATQIRCYIGYNGRASVSTAQVQARYGTSVVTTAEWIEAANNRTRDVAFIQVDRPFTGNLRTFNYVNTPTSGNGTLLGVVGYPGDKSLKDVGDGSDEYGAQMYEEYARTDYSIAQSPRNMIEYQVSTFGGQSGAPILRRSNGQLISIGTHCYGGGGDDSNSGNSIGSPYGNNYESFVSLFAQKSNFANVGEVRILDNQVNGTKSNDGLNGGSLSPISVIQRDPVKIIQRTESDEEGFIDILKSVARVGSKVLPVASPLLGPVGGLLGPVAGGLLGSLGAESAIVSGGDIASYSNRAILAEAALQAVLSSQHNASLVDVIDKMRDLWQIGAPKIDFLAPALAPIFTECGLELASHRLEKGFASNGQESVFLRQRRSLPLTLPESSFGEQSAFIQGIMGPTRPLAGEEGIFDWLGPVINTAVSISKPIVSQAASVAINSLAKSIAGGLSTESTISAPLSRNEEATKILLKRAVMAEAALQALMSLPRERLDKIELAEESGEAEGIFDFIKDSVQKIGPIAVDTATSAAKKYLPQLLKSVGQVSGTLGLQPEASLPTRGLARKPSFLDVLHGKDDAVKVSYARETSAGIAKLDVTPLIHAREMAWTPSNEWRKDWDENDDGPVVMNQPPADF